MKRLLCLLAFAAVFAVATPALAHVTVDSADAAPGGYGVVAVRVPTESDTASTTKVVLQLPTATPFLSVSVQPTSGWSATTTTARLAKPQRTDDGTVTSAVSTVTWTASAGGIRPGQFQQFFLSVGPFPKASSVTFKALQYYSDGSVVRWIETPAPGSSTEPEHPAPTLTLRTTGSAATPAASTSTTSSDGSDTSDTGALVLAVIALVVAVGGVAFGVISRAKAKGSSS